MGGGRRSISYRPPRGATGAAREHIARSGYDPVFGARPLKRFLQRHVEMTFSRKLPAGDITDHSRVTVEFKKGELVFLTAKRYQFENSYQMP